MIEEGLLQYGVFGLWTVSNLYLCWYLLRELRNQDKQLVEVIRNNTAALIKIYDRLKITPSK